MEDDFRKLVCTRLQTLPKGYCFSIGGVGNVTKEQAFKHVAENDRIGQLLAAVDRHYFDLIKSGEIYAGIFDFCAK